MKELVNKTLLGLLCGSLGFGVSQLTIAAEVRVHTTEIANVKHAFAEERTRTDARIFELVNQIKEQLRLNAQIVSQNQQLIAQNERYLSLLTDHLPQRKTP